MQKLACEHLQYWRMSNCGDMLVIVYFDQCFVRQAVIGSWMEKRRAVIGCLMVNFPLNAVIGHWMKRTAVRKAVIGCSVGWGLVIGCNIH